MQKFMPRSRIRIFPSEHTRSVQLDPKLTFWCVSYYLGAFGTIWLPYNTQCKTGQTGAKVRATKSPIGLRTLVFVHFVLFGCIWDCLVAFQYSVQNGSNCCKSSCHEVALECFATNAPDPPHWTLNSWFVAFHTIWVH